MIQAFDGKKNEIEFLEFENGKCEAEDFYKNELSEKDQKGIMKLFMTLGNVGFIKDIGSFRNEGNKIYAFKYGQVRFLCFRVEGQKKYVITHGFYKKQDKLPANEKDKALKLMKLYEKG